MNSLPFRRRPRWSTALWWAAVCAALLAATPASAPLLAAAADSPSGASVWSWRSLLAVVFLLFVQGVSLRLACGAWNALEHHVHRGERIDSQPASYCLGVGGALLVFNLLFFCVGGRFLLAVFHTLFGLTGMDLLRHAWLPHTLSWLATIPLCAAVSVFILRQAFALRTRAPALALWGMMVVCNTPALATLWWLGR